MGVGFYKVETLFLCKFPTFELSNIAKLESSTNQKDQKNQGFAH